jgi:hypothetical protein
MKETSSSIPNPPEEKKSKYTPPTPIEVNSDSTRGTMIDFFDCPPSP